MQTWGEELIEQGRQEGLAKGLAKGRAEDVIRILAARRVPVDDMARQRILSCMDLATLELWFDRALSATRLSTDGKVKLAKGMHSIKVWYYQGPMYEIALQLSVTPPGAEERRAFSMAEFNTGLGEAAKQLDATVTPEGIKVSLDAAVLFDTAKWELKPAAKKKLGALVQMLRAYPTARVEVSPARGCRRKSASRRKATARRGRSPTTRRRRGARRTDGSRS